jgi:hypothetical protein
MLRCLSLMIYGIYKAINNVSPCLEKYLNCNSEHPDASKTKV